MRRRAAVQLRHGSYAVPAVHERLREPAPELACPFPQLANSLRLPVVSRSQMPPDRRIYFDWWEPVW